MFASISLFFLAAHVAFECAEVGLGRTTGTPLWWFPVFSIAGALSAFLLVVRHYKSHLTNMKTLFAPIAQIVCGTAAAAFGVFDAFAVAFTVTPLILVWIYVIGNMGLVLYNEKEQHFFLTRSTFYACIRTSVEVVVRNTSFSRRLGRLVPFGFASCETIGMVCSKTKSYKFDVRSHDFVVYATLKSAVFLCLPLLEDLVLLNNLR